MATKTLCTGGGAAADYTSFATYETYLTGLGTWGANETLQIKWVTSADEVNYASQPSATPNGFTWTIEPYAGQGIADHASKATNPLFYDATKGACWKYAGGYNLIRYHAGPLIIRGMQLKNTSAGGYAMVFSNSTTLEISNCILQTDSTGPVIYTAPTATGTTTVSTNAMLPSGGSGVYIENGGGTRTLDITRNTIVNLGAAGSTKGIERGFGTVGGTLYLNAVAGFATDCSWTPTSGSHNATDSAGGGLPATNRVNSLVLADAFVSATVDFRLKSGSALINAGTAQGASTDIVGQADSGTRDIGAWEYQSAATFKLLTRVQAHGAFI